MAEKEKPLRFNDSSDTSSDDKPIDMSEQQNMGKRMFASADKIIKKVQASNSLNFLEQSKQTGGQ